ncbi:glycerol-3-phosphate 1-O-acyltransferase PlsY [Eisenibacter elegans]|uniref:glycerol-3-phosphate 1-O-acyltransferase PlsY n=1 Tax=Eisenibacter elegans TaxID=997 RepID=UPI000411907A|nr:glycerol-3-phosphate 1-O-acyltransferase PlsY [Eisenibacter elegans]
MFDLLWILLACVTAYLLGSIPTAVWFGKRYYGVDVRQYGSGNSGATNTFRVLGAKAGSIVMAIDMLKGWAATSLATLLVIYEVVSYDEFILYKTIFYKLLFGALAIVGHIFPVYIGFKGGKGVATLLGMMLAVNPQITLMCVGIFVLVLLLSKYVSLGSILATLSFPLLLLMPRFKPDDPELIVFGFLMFLVVVLTHQKNIGRLIQGEESKVNIRLKRSRS